MGLGLSHDSSSIMRAEKSNRYLLLSAVALMVAGSDRTGKEKYPGFPKNGKWKIQFENINKLP